MNIIIAPHVDDCLIGCYSLIKRGLIKEVVYIDTTPERWRLAKNAGKELGFSVHQLEFKSLYSYFIRAKERGDICLVPDNSDTHPLHRAINSVAKISGCKLGYYSVDMVASFIRELSEEEKKEKRAMLDKYYPDQSSLWEHNWKYFLFEGVVLDALHSTTITL